MTKTGRSLAIAIILIITVFAVIGIVSNLPGQNIGITAVKTSSALPASPSQTATVNLSGVLKVHFIDVGQADCILVQTPSGKNLVVDCGGGATENQVVAYFKINGVLTIDALVATHPHEDHIGGMDAVIRKFKVLSVYMPKASNTTNAYENVLTAIRDKGLTVNTAKRGVMIDIDPDVRIEMLSPSKTTYDELNDYSPVIRIIFGQTSFLLAGDAETVIENEILSAGINVSADVIKVGHHGSDSSSSEVFIKAVSPKYAVISVGAGNTYGHPTQNTLNKYTKAGAQILRTDLDGTVLMTSDGVNLSVLTTK